MQSKVNKLTKLDLSIVEPIIDAFYSIDTLFVVSPFIEQGNKDLYRLAQFRQSFSESGIAQIAHQILTQLNHLHSHRMVYKYLNP